ncbi:MAG: phenylacetate-CoA oxygenase/reductase subunit PaaK [Bacteroidetes bacterium]|nr:phenylacetate-CoA oxygenase/reductase subunit PaaK [Bacteroidota bacterium]
MNFYPLTIKNIRKETNDCVSISFNIPTELKQEFTYKQGQYITLKTKIEDQEIRRSYSLCSSPLEDDFRIAVKKVQNGLFSSYANDLLKIGDTLDVAAPNGKFYSELNESNLKKYLAIAAGSGITPILSIIKTTLSAEPLSEFILVYGNKNTGSIIFKEEIEALKNKFVGRLQLIHILSREKTDAPISHGRIDTDKLQQLSRLINWQSTNEFFICGPEEMILATKDFLENLNIDRKQIHFELFTTSAKSKNKTFVPQVKSEAKSKITIISDGRSFDIEIGFNDEINILDAALKNGADLPFACKGGVCCTCKAKLLEGQVEMDVNWGLEHEEIEQGFILTCQSHPITERVVVDYDVK